MHFLSWLISNSWQIVLHNDVPRFINYHYHTRWNHLLHGQLLESTFPFPLFSCHQPVVSSVPPPMKGALLFPRLIRIRTKWAAGEGGLCRQKKKYLWFKCRHISPKRLTSLFSQWILNVFDEGLVYSDKFNALWSRQNTVWVILTPKCVSTFGFHTCEWKTEWTLFERRSDIQCLHGIKKKQPTSPYNLVFFALCWMLCVHTYSIPAHCAPIQTDSHTHTLICRHREAWTCD